MASRTAILTASCNEFYTHQKQSENAANRTEDAYLTICRSDFLCNVYSFRHIQDVFLQYLQYLQGLGTFVLFFCCLLSKRGC